VAALIGNVALADADSVIVAIVLAVAAGAILAMVVDTMISRGLRDRAHEFAGMIAVVGFLFAFVKLSKLAG
jgi:ZIP family zinc transporter